METKNINTDELYDRLVCALTHDIHVCEECKKCEGSNCAYIRMNMINDLAKLFDKEVPWRGNDKLSEM